MRAMVIDGLGGADLFRMADLPVPQPGPGNVLVRIACASVNPADWKTREGMLDRYISYHFPFVLGFDLAGTIAAVGEGVSGFGVGDRVFGTSLVGQGVDGSYAEYAVTSPFLLQPLPPELSFAEGAALPTAGSTAYGAIVDSGGLTAGQSVLINGGAGGVGSLGIQIARALGSRVAATCSPGNAAFVQELGADIAIDYRAGHDAVAAAVRAWEPDGVHLVIDAVGRGSLVDIAPKLVRRGGLYIEIETLFPEASAETRRAAEQAGISIRSNMAEKSRLSDHLAGLATMVADGRVRIPPLSIMPLGAVGEAHRLVEAGHVRGKIVLEVADPEGL